MKWNYFLFALLTISFISCDPDDPEDVNEEELITTVTYTLSPTSGGSDVVLSFQDLDGDGGNDAIIVGGTLASNTTYNGSLTLLNESEDPVEDITEEVQEEDDEHQFFFQVDNLDLAVQYADQDGDGNPIGLLSTVTTRGAGNGSLTVILKHEPEKDAAGVSSGDITNAGGETDISVTFPVTIQ